MNILKISILLLVLSTSCAQPIRKIASQETPPESVIESIKQDVVIHPETIPSSRFNEDYMVTAEDSGLVVGFTLENNGINKIIPKKTEIGSGPSREYEFAFPERARQNIILMITDTPSSKLSELMETYLTFFPREVVPAISRVNDQLIVTLPNQEEIHFNYLSKEITSGVLSENAPIDLGPDRFKRKFAQISYSGTGVMIRVDRRGEDPRIGSQIATISHKTDLCKIPVNKLWTQDGLVHFRFPTDAEFDVFLKANCKFQLL